MGNRRESSGRFNFVQGTDGDVSFDDTEAHAVLTSSLEDRDSWAFDPQHGSELSTLRSLTTRTPSQAESMEQDALDGLVRANVIAPPTVAASGRVDSDGVARLNLDVRWTTPGGSEGRVDVEV